jgi:outer membrane protein
MLNRRIGGIVERTSAKRFLSKLVKAAAILLVTALDTSAQTNPSLLTLDDCIRLALSAPSAVTLARQQSLIANYEVSQARAGMLPQARVNNFFTYNSPLSYNPDIFSFIALNGIREYTFLFNTAQELDTSGRLRAALARAHANQDIATAGLGLTQRDLKRAVTTTYYRLLLSRRLVQVSKDALSEASSFERRTALLAKNGEVAQADVVKASAQVAFQEQVVNAAELEAQTANHELASFWTTKVTDPLAVLDILDQPVPSPPDLPSEANTAAPFLRRLEFDFLDAQRRGFLADARRAKADLFPQAAWVFQYGIDSTQAHIRDRGYAAFVNLNIPVFDWFKSIGASRQFQQQAQQIVTNRQIAERTFSRDYQNALAQVKMIYARISITQSQVKSSDQNLLLSRVRYEGGEGTALDVVAAQNQLAQARTNYYTTLVNYLIALADLEVASGR